MLPKHWALSRIQQKGHNQTHQRIDPDSLSVWALIGQLPFWSPSTLTYLLGPYEGQVESLLRGCWQSWNTCQLLSMPVGALGTSRPLPLGKSKGRSQRLGVHLPLLRWCYWAQVT